VASTFDLDDLIDRVESFRCQQELQVLASLTEENRRLQGKLARLHQRYTWARNLLREARSVLHGLEQAIRAFQNRRLQAQAEQPGS
jgi:chromosome segregation ATPase